MADSASLERLAAQAEDALRRQDWPALSLLDGRLSAFLAARGGRFDDAERRELARLKALWRRSAAELGGECDRLQGILNDIGEHAEARSAYAVIDAWND
ncbi:hypothetical protein [Paludibacterium paludis]|uniref:Protein FliT n=1 Tax=Paludibacterium paludis TaxID=1225769 RepID=A0A918NXD7_9NEIS|nr:hypothetical protein [Paludibacterium paludis]GGY04639.1 hypothetical protein GCM10011289_03960 [Paludibacterium paludis]